MAVGLKVCGVTRAEDLRACIELGVDAVGFNLWPGSKRCVDLHGAEGLLARVPELGERSLLRVGVVVDLEVDAIARAIATLDLDLIQPHGDGPVEPIAQLASDCGIGWI